MTKSKKKEPQKSIQTGRNLPHSFESYHPGETAKSGGKAEPLVAPRAKPGWRKIFFRSLLALFLLALAVVIFIGVWDVRNISTAEKKMFGTGNVMSLLSSSPLKQTSDGRVNVLLVGYSTDDPGHPGAKLTDSIMLMSLNPAKHTGYLLSIPRDLYVNIPGSGYHKINEAYQDGGMPLLERVVSTSFQQPISYYALVNYAAVRDIVNALNGITVCIKSSDPRGLYDPNISRADHGPLRLANGCQKLNGQTALNLSRARGDPAPDGRVSYGFAQSDFDRTEHQRQILSAVKAELNWKLILDPRKNSQILDAMANNIKTNVRAGEAKPLFSLFNSIPQSKLKSLSLRDLDGKNYLVSTQYEGDTLSPAAGLSDFSQINSVLQKLNNQ